MEFCTIQKSSKCLLLIVSLVSFINIMGSDKELICRERYFMYTINSKDPRIYLLGTPCFNIVKLEKKL
jgi:hypothetical protein